MANQVGNRPDQSIYRLSTLSLPLRVSNRPLHGQAKSMFFLTTCLLFIMSFQKFVQLLWSLVFCSWCCSRRMLTMIMICCCCCCFCCGFSCLGVDVVVSCCCCCWSKTILILSGTSSCGLTALSPAKLHTAFDLKLVTGIYKERCRKGNINNKTIYCNI